MPSLITSDNGVSSGSAGLKTTASNDGILALQTTTAGGAATTAVTINTSQNVGIGTTSPSGRLHTVQSNGVNYFESPGISSIGLQFVTNGTNRYRIGIPSGSNDLQFLAGGTTETMRLDSSGNLGLGVTPSAWQSGRKALQVGNASINSNANSQNQLGANFYYDGTNNKYISSDFSTVYQQLSGQHQWYTAASGTAGNNITFTQAMTLDASGNLGIGVTSPVAVLDVKEADAGQDGIFRLFPGTGNSIQIRAIAQADTTTSALSFYTVSGSSSFERARIDSSGNLLLMTTSTSITADVGIKFINGSSGNSYMGIVNSQSTNASANYHLYSTGAGAYRFYVGMGGTVYATSTTISSLSDQRHKENIRDLNVGLSEIMALKPRLYDWKEGKGADIKNARGFIAQEFEEVFPDLIDEWKDPAPEGEEPYKSVRADLIPVLVKAIQELKTIVDAQAAEIAALKGN